MTIKILSNPENWGSDHITAAGALIIAADSLKVLTVLRSHQVDDGGVW